MWKRKVSLKEQYGTLEHFLKGDEPCHYIGQRYIEGTNFYARREWRGVKDTLVDYCAWLKNLAAMAKMVASAPIPCLKGFWEYRWMGSYLGTFMFIDRLFEV